MKFKHVVCGGTFDRLHAGHKKLLEACMEQGARVTIGITDRAMTRHKPYAQTIQSYHTRYNTVKRFTSTFDTPISILKISDIYGSTLKDMSIDALFVTEETVKGAEKINNERIKIGMKPLSIIIIPYAFDDMGVKISSERVRSGEISREGIHYYKYLISKDIHILPESFRNELRSPLGRVIPSFNSDNLHFLKQMKVTLGKYDPTTFISIGDIVTYNLKKAGIQPSISIIDGITQRKALNNDIFQYIYEKGCHKALNKKGSIQKGAVIELNKLIHLGHSKAIRQLNINGEEDLLTLVAILLSPLGSYVWYGQQDVGAVCVHVTEKMKGKVYNLIRQFK